MAWLDAVKGAIFTPDPNAPKTEATPTPFQGRATTIAGAGGIPAGQPVMMSSPVNPEFVAAIRKAVLGRNTALTQLMATADKLVSIIPDAGQRLKAAFATAGDGRTVAQIVQAVDVHMSDVDGEEQKFKAVLAGKVQAEVAPLEQQAQLLLAQLDRAQQEIVAAQARIVELTGAVSNLTQQAGQAQQTAVAKRQELELMESNFKLAANAVRAELQSNKAAVASALA